MALELRFYTLVMRKEKVAHLFKEEILLYEANRLKDLTLQTFQCDQHLASYGAMAANYFDDFINDLLKLGLKERADFEIVDGFRNGQHA